MNQLKIAVVIVWKRIIAGGVLAFGVVPIRGGNSVKTCTIKMKKNYYTLAEIVVSMSDRVIIYFEQRDCVDRRVGLSDFDTTVLSVSMQSKQKSVWSL